MEKDCMALSQGPETYPDSNTTFAVYKSLSEVKAPRTVQVSYATIAKIIQGMPTRIDGVLNGEVVRFESGARALVKSDDGEIEYLPPQFDEIPDLMAKRRQFCLRGGTDGKQPFIREWEPDSQRKFTSKGWDKYPENWLTLQEALKAWEENKNYFVGVGYLNAKKNPQIVGGDIDACVDPETGELSSFAQELIQGIKPFYYETSPSGCGIRFFVLGGLPSDLPSISGNGDQDLPEEMQEHILNAKPKLRDKQGKKFNGFELYMAHRHLSLTGEYLGGFEPEDRTEEIEETLKEFRRPAPKSWYEAKKLGFVETGTNRKGNSIGYLPETKEYPAQWYEVVDMDYLDVFYEISTPRKKEVSCPTESTKSKRKGYPQLDIMQVALAEGFKISDNSGSNVLGYFPEVGSSTGRNVSIDVEKGVFCFLHDGLNTGGDVWNMLARLSGVISWEDKAEGALNDEEKRKLVAAYAIKKGYANLGDFISPIIRGILPADSKSPEDEDLKTWLDSFLDANPDLRAKYHNPAEPGEELDIETYLCESLYEGGLNESEIYKVMSWRPGWDSKDESYKSEVIQAGIEKSQSSTTKIRRISEKDGDGAIGVDQDGTVVRIVEGKKFTVKEWISDCPVAIDTETTARDSTEFLFVGQGAKDRRKVSFTLPASALAEPRQFRAAVINAFGAKNRVGKLDFEIVQQLTVNPKLKKRVEVPVWDNNIPLIPGMDVGEDIEFKLSPKIPAEVKAGDLEEAMPYLRKLLQVHKYAPLLVAVILGAPAVARWRKNDRFGLGLWGSTGTMKTSTALAAMSIWGTGYIEAPKLKAGRGGSTPVGAMEVFSAAGIMPQIYDNVKGVDLRDTPAYVATIHAIIEGEDKVRGKKEGGIREGREFLCTPILTGESRPTEASTTARVLNLEWSPVNTEALSEVQQHVDLMPVIGYHWLKHLTETEDSLDKDFEKERAANLAEISKLGSPNAGRLATMQTMLTKIWEMLEDSPMGEVFKEYHEDFLAVLEEAIEKQAQKVADEWDLNMFLDSLFEYIERNPSSIRGARDSEREGVIGVWAKDGVKLYPQATLEAVRPKGTIIQMQSIDSITQALGEQGMLIPDGDKRKCRMPGMAGEKKRVRGWYLKLTPENTPESILEIKARSGLSDKYYREALEQKEREQKELKETILDAPSIEEANKLREDHFKKIGDEIRLRSPTNWSEKMICHICKEPKMYETKEIDGGRVCKECFIDLDGDI
jgi:hypothetical protein